MTPRVDLNGLDFVIFAVYMVVSLVIGFWAGRHGRRDAKDYFLGDKGLPWYVVGTSMVAAVISSEHFIAQVGAGYSQGIVVAAFGWNAWIVYTLLIWIFLPYYMRTGLYTMPEFLERRYNTACRYVFAAFLIVGYVTALIAGPLYAGGIALESMFGLDVMWGIVGLGLLTGAYTIYGGLRSAAWTDFMQMSVLLVGGIMVPVLGLMKVGGLSQLVHEMPGKFQVFHSPRHELFPVTGVFTSFLSVGIWYNCASQHLVQRCLAAKDEWHARVGVISAGFLHVITPALFVLPGIIAYKMFPNLARPDSAYLMLVKTLIPSGLRGLILAAMAAALMSHISSMLNSTSTILTMDVYQKAKPGAEQRDLVRAGQWSGALILLISIVIALYFSTLKGSFLFVIIQDIFAYIAPPFAVIFTLGILWRRATGKAALVTICFGFSFTLLLQYVLFPRVAWLHPYQNYLHRALISWVFCMIVMIATSLATAAMPKEKTAGIIWSPRYALLPQKLQAIYGGWKDFRLWWLIFVTTVLAIYGFFLWFRFQHPENP